MKITSHQLEAFYETAIRRSFSKAAGALGITQSALSQRIANLENDLEVTLLIRDPSGPVLTPSGETLLRHCQVTYSLEQEVLSQLKSSADQLGGSLRVAGFSSVLRSVIVPSLAPFLRANSRINCEFRSYEVSQLVDVLRNAEADFVILDYKLGKKGITEQVLGVEEYVVIESAKFEAPEDLYLDHDPSDTATEVFFSHQGHVPKKWRRSYMGDVYGIITGVELGLGRAVMPRHLIDGNLKVKLVKGFKKYQRPVVLHFFEQPYYSKLHQEAVGHLVKNAPALFK